MPSIFLHTSFTCIILLYVQLLCNQEKCKKMFSLKKYWIISKSITGRHWEDGSFSESHWQRPITLCPIAQNSIKKIFYISKNKTSEVY